MAQSPCSRRQQLRRKPSTPHPLFHFTNTTSQASVLYWLMSFLKPLSPRFPISARATLSSHPSVADSLLSLYDFTSSPDDPEQTFLQVLQFINDISFTLGSLAFAKGFSAAGTKTNLFFFNEPNPWPGKFTGKATHVLDVVFLFQNYNEKLPPQQRKAAEQMGLDFARFVSGQEPWERFEDRDGGRRAKVYGPSSTSTEARQGEARVQVVEDALKGKDTERKPEIVQIADQVGWDTLAAVFVDFILGKHLG
jgi:carboxylesterase type B